MTTYINDCNALKESSKYICDWMIKQPNVNEVSLTDWILYNTSQKVSCIKKYYKFTQREEGKMTGADCEWWFRFNASAFKMRIQAKKLSQNETKNYHGIAYKNDHGLQIEKLLCDATIHNFMAFYVFYTTEQGDINCDSLHSLKINEGVYLAGAKTIYSEFILSEKKCVKAQDILKNSIALSCLLCCPNTTDNNSTSNQNSLAWFEFIRKYFKYEIEYDVDYGYSRQHVKQESPGSYPEIPQYIESFLQQDKENNMRLWEREFHREIEGVNSLAVFDLRANN